MLARKVIIVEFSEEKALPVQRWRVVDLVVVAVLGTTFGVVYWALDQLWTITAPLFIAFPPAQAVTYGLWMLPQVLAAMIIRRRGAALFGSMSAVIVSVFMGNAFGLTVLIYGVVQGLATEAVFALGRYRWWTWLAAGLATALATFCGTFLDILLYYPFWVTSWKLAYVLIGCTGGFVLGAVIAPLVVRRLGAAGVLDGLPSGRMQFAEPMAGQV